MHFPLVRYFVVASLGMFGLVALALVYLEYDQSVFFKGLQRQQLGFFGTVQEGFAGQQEATARRDLLAIHEAGHVSLTRLFANTLWEKDFAPLVARAQSLPLEKCRALPDEVDKAGNRTPGPDKRACQGDLARQIAGSAGFRELDAKVFMTMKKSSVFKIKVYDLRGLTVYSSEHKQIGEDKSGNAGWRSAVAGRPASELTYRDSFSSFEGVVENRDLIGSYVPLVLPGTDRIVGVFEVYSDVTPFLGRIRQTALDNRKLAAANQLKLEEEAAQATHRVDVASIRLVSIVVVLLGILFGALFVIVRRADVLIRAQELARANTLQQLAQAEKMASLGQMVAGVAHQFNTPLAFAQNNLLLVRQALGHMKAPLQLSRTMAETVRRTEGDQAVIGVAKLRASLPALDADTVDLAALDGMIGDALEGVAQMSEMVTHLRDFTRLDRAHTVSADLNKSLHTVVHIAKSVLPEHVVILESFGKLPPLDCNPSQLNQVFLNLINNAADAMDGVGTITVRSVVDGDAVKIEVVDTGAGIPDDVLPRLFEPYFTTKAEGTGLGLSIAREIVRAHGGDLTVETFVGSGSTFTVRLPVVPA